MSCVGTVFLRGIAAFLIFRIYILKYVCIPTGFGVLVRAEFSVYLLSCMEARVFRNAPRLLSVVDLRTRMRGVNRDV